MCKLVYGLCFILLALGVANTDKALTLKKAKLAHTPRELTDEGVAKLAALSDLTHFYTVLDEIMIPRVVGTPEHSKVGDYIVKQMMGLNWAVEQDVFTDKTPVFGRLNFRNIIARLNPDADRFLVLACHYDSKLTREHVFVGATDSAVPCAMMINLAKVMSTQLAAIAARTEVSLAFVFFDGEEAFRQWGPTDSIYGARHLARLWHNTPYAPNNNEANQLDKIDMLMLLDLLGTPDPVFYSYFPATEKWYARLAAAEERLAEHALLASYSRGKPEQTYFRLRSMRSYVEDDHTPFLRRNVNILHIIPHPFPDVWHREDDDRTALDFNTIENLNKIIRVFVAEYLHIEP